jgi:hypothetical protein
MSINEVKQKMGYTGRPLVVRCSVCTHSEIVHRPCGYGHYCRLGGFNVSSKGLCNSFKRRDARNENHG